MKTKFSIIIILALLLVTTATITSMAETSSYIAIPGESMGNYHLGISINELKKMLGEPGKTKSFEEDGVKTYIYTFDSGSLFFEAHNKNDVIFNILTNIPAYKTKDGVGVTSSINDIKSLYGKPTFDKSSDGFLTLFYDNIGLGFMFDEKTSQAIMMNIMTL